MLTANLRSSIQCGPHSLAIGRRPGLTRFVATWRVDRQARPGCAWQCYASVPARQLLEDCSELGRCRFIVLGDGAILESVGTFVRPKYTDVPKRGVLATISSEDKAFECHVYLSKLRQAKIVKSAAKQGGYDIYATRFLGEDGKLLMSCLLHGSSGEYDAGAVAAWQNLQQKYGEDVQLL